LAKEIRTEIEIEASAERVWNLLTDFAHFPEWNPFIRQVKGSASTGNQLTVTIQPPGGKTMTFKPHVLDAEPNRQLRWIGRVLIRGLFDGEHSFGIEPLGENRVRFTHRERFSGLFVPFFSTGRSQQGFEEMNKALKTRAEQPMA